jgi:hypothetical protein
MPTSILPARYKINGLLDTKRPVMENLERICNACGTFLTYDIHTGEWSVVINRADATVAKAFTDANVIGPVQVQGTSITNLYNSVRVEFPLRDTADELDFIEIEIPPEDRYANEPDNVLEITLDMCNEPVQAEIIGLIELKQARLDQIVTFRSDYSTLNLNAGDIITLTHDIYQFSAKKFRVISLTEVDADDGSIQIEITALAYDPDVYDTSDLGRYIRTDRNGIKTIGAIGQPIEPVLYVYAQDRRPGIQVEAVVPSGVVESMELWLSSDNSNFVQIGTQYAEGGGTLAAGTTVLFDYDQLDSQNIYVKVRAMNSTTTGPFSVSAAFLSYVPQQRTDAIIPTTDVLDNAGSSLLGLLGSNILIALIKRLVEDNSTASDGIYQKVLDTLTIDTGQDLQAATFYYTAQTSVSNTTVSSKLAASTATLGTYGEYSTTLTDNRDNWISAAVATLPAGYNTLTVQIKTPSFTMDYYALDQDGNIFQSGVYAQPAFEVNLMYGNTYANSAIIAQSTVDWTTNTTQVAIDNPAAGTYYVGLRLIPTYDLNMNWTGRTTPTGATPARNQIYFFDFDDLGADTSNAVFVAAASLN